jgi:hypothetical protein
VGLARLFDSRRELAHMCRVVKFYLLQSALLIRISTTPSDMCDVLLVESKRSN